MANTRTIAFQVPEDLFQRIKDYLQRNNMTQRQFIIGLIEEELDREMVERTAEAETVDEEPEEESESESYTEEADYDQDSEAAADEDEAEDEEQGFSMSM